MKKVCMIIPHSYSPPHCRTYDKAKILSSNGYEVITIALGNKNLSMEETLEYTKVQRVFDVGIYKPKLSIINNPALVFKIFLKAVRTKADVYHVCDMDNVLVGFMLKCFTSKKVIYDIGDDFPSYNRFPHSVQSIIRGLEGYLLKFYDTIIVSTESLKKDRIKYTRDIKVIYYTPDPSFNPENVARVPKDTDHVAIFEGQICAEKGVIEILKALSLVIAEGQSIKLLLIGDFRDPDEKENIISLISYLNLQEHVHITGWMKHTDVPKYVNTGDVGIIILRPWSYSYVISVPNKLIDYMACGKPVVASNGFPEMENIVKAANCGILVDYDDPKQIAEALIYLLGNDKERKKMGQNARNYIEKNHNWKSFEKKLLDIYHKLGS
jgi:glycosyltransferase involved in cell wall biosynthesis